MFNKLSQCSIGRSCEYLGQSELGIWGFPGGNFRGNFELLAAICKQMRCQKCEIVCERASVVAAENRHLVLCQCRSITDYLGRLCKYKGGEGFEQLNGKRERERAFGSCFCGVWGVAASVHYGDSHGASLHSLRVLLRLWWERERYGAFIALLEAAVGDCKEALVLEAARIRWKQSLLSLLL